MKLAKTALFFSALIETALFAAPAWANSPTQDAYGCQGCTNITQQSSLPFTGLNLGLLVLFGVLLIGAGFAVLRSTRSAGD